MTYRTISPVEIRDYAHNRGACGVHFTIPAGSRVEPCNDGTGQFFLSAPFPGVPPFYRHDAEHYGVRVSQTNVKES